MKIREIIALVITILFTLPSVAPARYYDPKTGRYLTPDPIGLEGGINPYVYVENDPVNQTDPSGLSPVLPSEAQILFPNLPKEKAEETYNSILETNRRVLDILLLLAPELSAARPMIRIGPRWRPRSVMPSGCEGAARQINRHVEGTIHTITPKKGLPSLGGFRGQSPGWASHDVVLKDGRVYDVTTGHKGLPIDEYKALWEYPDAIDFGF